jgi:uncharacterized repeat protein (TIGR03806 family)
MHQASLFRRLWLVALAGLLCACGGGGGGAGDPVDPTESGLDSRPSNASCLAPPLPGAGADATAVDAFPAAPAFDQPTKLLQAPGDGSRWFVLEKPGRIRVFDVTSPGNVSTWLDFTGRVNATGEGGMLGMAFHPDFPATREVFVSYTAPGSPLVSRISRVILDDATTPSGPLNEQVILTINQPYTNHNGGDIAFGADGLLYIGMGDGGSGGDPQNHAQNTTDLLGAMLRIAVVGVAFPSPGYTIPADNPFAGNAKCGPGTNADDCPEIFAWGFRNPWRWSFDRPTSALWLADVGQNAWEEIDVVTKGGNYGWRCREGAHPFNGAGCPGGLVDPVAEYDHGSGVSITGGYVYRGQLLPALQGRYVFADYAPNPIRALRDDGAGGYAIEELTATAHSVSAFGTDQDGELYFTDFGDGRIYRLAPGGGGLSDGIPDDLADTGCVDPANPTQPAAGLIPYDINAPFWSDGADKERWLALPDGATIAIGSDGDWEMPPGTVLVKLFRLDGNPIETRLLMRHPGGEWRGYTYEWNDSLTAATRVSNGKTRRIGAQQWTYPSEAQCLQCHTAAAGFSLGPETAQLNRDFTYPATARTANQLATLGHIGMFRAPLPAEPADLPALADPADASQPLAGRARAWLHTNCAQCHRPGGPTPSTMDWRYNTALATTAACNVAPTSGDLGLASARLVAPGDAARSVVPARMNRRDALGMPPLGSNLVDGAGVTLVNDWINSLTSCL